MSDLLVIYVILIQWDENLTAEFVENAAVGPKCVQYHYLLLKKLLVRIILLSIETRRKAEETADFMACFRTSD